MEISSRIAATPRKQERTLRQCPVSPMGTTKSFVAKNLKDSQC